MPRGWANCGKYKTDRKTTRKTEGLKDAGNMAESTSLSCISAAKRALAKATTLNDVLDIRDRAEALRVYVKAAGDSLDAQIAAADIRLRAERKAGEMLSEMQLHNGDPLSQDATRLSDLGINRTQSSRWQLSAKLPEADYEAMVATCLENKKELTQSAVLAAARKLVSEPKSKPLKTAKLDAVELVGELRQAIADFAERFGPDRMDILINVLRSELSALENSDDN